MWERVSKESGSGSDFVDARAASKKWTIQTAEKNRRECCCKLLVLDLEAFDDESRVSCGGDGYYLFCGWWP